LPKIGEIPGKAVALVGYSAFVRPNSTGRQGSLEPFRTLIASEGLMERGRLRNPHFLIRPFVRCEAVLSSKIEGTQATLGELLAAEAGAVVDRSPEDIREVGNYVVALEQDIARVKRLPLGVRLTRELHEKFMTGVPGPRATPGRFRTVQNWIGNPGSTAATASYVPPPASRSFTHFWMAMAASDVY
jgi:Fic family protein